MSRTLVVEPGPFTWRLGVVDDAGLARLRAVDLVAGVEGAWFRARVTARAPDLGGVFADVGAVEPVFVRLPAARRRRPPDEGAALLVQGVADAVAGKGPRATTRLAFEGAHLTLRGDGDGPHVRPGADDPADLRRRAARLFAGRPVELHASAAGVADDVLTTELTALAAIASTVRSRFEERTAPGPLLDEDARLALAIRALAAGVGDVVTTPDGALRVARLATPAGLGDRVRRSAEPWGEAGAEGGPEEALQPDVPLEGGAALVIEPTAACVAVDVDRRAARGPAARVNTAAAAALVRAVAVRELAGQLVVDFLDPGGAEGRGDLARTLARTLAPADAHVVTVLRSGLAVLERPRRAAALHERRDPSREAAERLLRWAAGHAIFEAAVAADVDDLLARPGYAEASRAWLAAHGSRLVRRRDPALPPATFITESRKP